MSQRVGKNANSGSVKASHPAAASAAADEHVNMSATVINPRAFAESVAWRFYRWLYRFAREDMKQQIEVCLLSYDTNDARHFAVNVGREMGRLSKELGYRRFGASGHHPRWMPEFSYAPAHVMERAELTLDRLIEAEHQAQSKRAHEWRKRQ